MANNGNAKKMSLEEFLGDDTLGDSVWNEDDINLDAINNTTSIEVLKQGNSNSNNNSHDNAFGGYRNNKNNHHDRGDYSNEFDSNQDPLADSSQGPPYIVKFSHLPPRFANSDIEDLFQAKYTKFVKFKLLWEINRNPSILTLKEGSVFDQNFKKDFKVAFVELFSFRDMHKIMSYWRTPLKEIYHIVVEPAEFEDFKEYMARAEIEIPASDDPGKPYIAPKPKPNPFGAAKPVDTQSKVLDIEEKMELLHVEDTTTLRRLSQGEPIESLKPKVKLLKKPQLSYSQVLQKSVDDAKKSSSPSSLTNEESVSVPESNNTSRATSDETAATYGADAESVTLNEDGSKHFTFKNVDRETDSNNFNRSNYKPRRGRGGFNRGGFNNRGGNFNSRGGYNNRGSYSNRGGRGGYNNDNGKFNNNTQNVEEKEQYSLFAPASGFLRKEKADGKDFNSNSSHYHKNYNDNKFGNRGRGGYNRGRGGSSYNRGGRGTFES